MELFADFSPVFAVILIVLGVIAGIINTLAGGGSNLTLPALMMMGMSPEVANATNRVGVFLQCLVGVRDFKKYDKLSSHDIGPILVPTIIGGLVGAAFASYMPSEYLKPTLLGAMLTMATIILIRPSTVLPEEGTPTRKVQETPVAMVALFAAGFYGGFVQAGVGFILIAALAGSLHYDIVRTNALKMLCTAVFTAVALGIFIINDQVNWMPGLILAVGTMAGAKIGVRLALNLSQNVLKWFLFLMTLVASGAAMVF